MVYPKLDFPCAAVASTTPSTKKIVAAIMPVRRPSRSINTPKKSIPKISPIKYELDRRDLMVEDIALPYLALLV